MDYIGIANDLKQAMRTYTNANGRGEPTVDNAQALRVLLEQIDIIRAMLKTPIKGKSCDIASLENQAITLLPQAANHILGVKGGKKRFLMRC